MHPRFHFVAAASLCAAMTVGIMSTPASAIPLDPPTVTVTAYGHGKLEVLVTAGASGCPDGFTLWWMKQADFQSNGDQWFLYGDSRQGEASFVGEPTLNVTPGEPESFLLGPNQSITIQIGDIFDETGVVSYSLDELYDGHAYVVCAFANAGSAREQSPYSENIFGATTASSSNCTYTIGYWKTHGAGACHSGNNANAWPVSSLTLGSVSYTAAQLCAILNQPAQGNGLVSLAHQLIAAKLNIAAGASSAAVVSFVSAADAMIGSLIVPPIIGGGSLPPSSTSALTETLDDYNNGIIGPGHCGTTNATEHGSWGHIKSLY